MKCEICLKHETVGTFVTACKNYNKNSILWHEKYNGHNLNVKKPKTKNDQNNLDFGRTSRIL